MPRKLLDVSDAWLTRFMDGKEHLHAGLEGLEHQIILHQQTGSGDADDLLEQLRGQINGLRRNLEAWKLVF